MLADIVLVVHVAVVLFNVGGLIAIWLAALGDWAPLGWVRNRRFRFVHLGALGFVTIEALLGMTCPLTHLEDWLRDTEGQRGFIARWLHHWLYWDFPLWGFALAYLSVFLLAVAAWWVVPPAKKR